MQFVDKIRSSYHISYTAALDYHNAQHAKNVTEVALKLADRARAFGYAVDTALLEGSSLLHDSYYNLNPAYVIIHDGTGYRRARFREEVHAWFGAEYCRKLNAPESFCHHVGETILSTWVGAKLHTTEAKLLRAADLHGVGFNTSKRFMEDTQRLYRETQKLSGDTMPFTQFVRNSVNFLGLYSIPSIRLTPVYSTSRAGQPTRSQWHIGATTNMLRLLSEHGERPPAVVAEIGCTQAPLIVGADSPLADANTLYIGIGHPGVLETAIPSIDTHYQKIGAPAPMRIGIPTEEGVSLPDASADMIVMSARAACIATERHPIEELRRVLKPQGAVRLIDTTAMPITHESFRSAPHFATVCEWLTRGEFVLSHEDTHPLGREMVFIRS